MWVQGKFFNIVAKVNPSNATNKKLVYTSSKTSVATVNQMGKVTAKKLGRVTITVKAENGIEARCTVDVISRTIEGSLRVNLSQGGTYDFSAISHENRSTPSFDVRYGTYAGYTVIGEDVFPRSLLTN